MTFRRRVRLDPGQVRDMRGKGGLALGGGLGGVILVVAFLLLGLDPGSVPTDALNGITVGGGGQDNTQLEQECQTGEDANQRQDCRMVGFVNAIQAYWRQTLDGYELAQRMRDKLGETSPRFVALTGYGRDNDRARSAEAGFARHLVKPVDLARLLATVTELSDNGAQAART